MMKKKTFWFHYWDEAEEARGVLQKSGWIMIGSDIPHSFNLRTLHRMYKLRMKKQIDLIEQHIKDYRKEIDDGIDVYIRNKAIEFADFIADNGYEKMYIGRQYLGWQSMDERRSDFGTIYTELELYERFTQHIEQQSKEINNG